jgi:hypothetical protein
MRRYLEEVVAHVGFRRHIGPGAGDPAESRPA